jgi:hypothetical protein
MSQFNVGVFIGIVQMDRYRLRSQLIMIKQMKIVAYVCPVSVFFFFLDKKRRRENVV